MNTVPIVRPATSADAAAIADIHVDSWRSTYYGMIPQSYLSRMSRPALTQQWAARAASTDDSETILVAERAGVVAGFVTLTNSRDHDVASFSGEVTMLYVHPGHTGAGLGTLLMTESADILHVSEYRWLVVWVVEKNTAARAFYRRIGLRNDGASRIDRFDGQGVWVVRYAQPINPVIDFDALGRVTAH